MTAPIDLIPMEAVVVLVFARNVTRAPDGWTASGPILWRVQGHDRVAFERDDDNTLIDTIFVTRPQTPEPESAQADPGPHGPTPPEADRRPAGKTTRRASRLT